MAIGPTLLASLIITWTVCVARLASFAIELVVTPVATVTEHHVEAGRLAVPAVRVMLADAVPEFVGCAANDVVPHPVTVGVDKEPKTKSGNVRRILSPVLIIAFETNANAADDEVAVTGFPKDKLSLVKVGTAIASEAVIETAEISVPEASVRAIVRVLMSAA